MILTAVRVVSRAWNGPLHLASPESLAEGGRSPYSQPQHLHMLGLLVPWRCQCSGSSSWLQCQSGIRLRSPPSSVQRPHTSCMHRSCVSQPQPQRSAPELSLCLWLMLSAPAAFNSIPGVLSTGHHHQYMWNGCINLVKTHEGRTGSFCSNESQSWGFEHGDSKGN